MNGGNAELVSLEGAGPQRTRFVCGRGQTRDGAGGAGLYGGGFLGFCPYFPSLLSEVRGLGGYRVDVRNPVVLQDPNI